MRNEKELALEIIKDAKELYQKKITQYPMIMIDKKEYSNYNIKLLKKELENNNFTIFDGATDLTTNHIFKDKYIIMELD